MGTLNSGVLALPKGIYLLKNALTIRRPMTLTSDTTTECDPSDTRGTSCAILIAAVDIAGAGNLHDMLLAANLSEIHLKRIILDGNKEERGPTATYCNGTTDAYEGSNANLDRVTHSSVVGVVSRNAVCGTGLHFFGKNSLIKDSVFITNGLPQKGLWADGLTLLFCENCLVTGNRFEDNTDVNLIFGGGTGTSISENRFKQVRVPSFASLMLDNFNGTTSGDFRGSILTKNHIDCGNFLCSFGINIGPKAWYPSRNILGGAVRGNTIIGAKIGVLVGGAGTRDSPTALRMNEVFGSPACGTLMQFSCGMRSVCARKYDTGSSVIDIEPEPDTLHEAHPSCP